MLMLTTSGISKHQSRTTLNLSRSHAGSAMILTATDMSSERANSSASKFLESVTRFGVPCFCPWIRRVNADVNDLGNFQTPIAHYLESFAVPRGIGNDIDSDRYVERASELQCLEIFGKCYAIRCAMFLSLDKAC